MRSVRPEKKDLENIGRSIVSAGALSESEIERIAGREDLFSGVLSKITTAPAESSPAAFSLARFVRRHELGIGGAIAAVVCVGVFGLYIQQRPAEIVSKGIQLPAVQPETARPDITPQVMVKGFTQGRAKDQVISSPAVVEPAAAERAVYHQPRAVAPIQPQRANSKDTAEAEFYPVTYTGDNGESARGGRVIRVDVSRSTLFAMGVNVPLENESETVKADLLVGPDGVTRAIRLVE